MTNQERLMLVTVKAVIDTHVRLAKGAVRASHECRQKAKSDYSEGFHDGAKYRAVCALRAMRGVQRHIHEYCKGVGYYAQETPTP